MSTKKNEVDFRDIHQILLDKHDALIHKELSILKFCGCAGTFYYIDPKARYLIKEKNLALNNNVLSAFYSYSLPPVRIFKEGERIYDDFYKTNIIADKEYELKSVKKSDFILDSKTYELFVEHNICMRNNEFYSVETVDKTTLRTFKGNTLDIGEETEHKEIFLFINTKDAMEIQSFDFIYIHDTNKTIQALDFICILNKKLDDNSQSIIRIFNYIHEGGQNGI